MTTANSILVEGLSNCARNEATSERYFNQQTPPKPRSPFYKKLLSEGGGVIDLAGRALTVVSFAAMFVKPAVLPLPGALIELGVGVIAILWGGYLKAEAER